MGDLINSTDKDNRPSKKANTSQVTSNTTYPWDTQNPENDPSKFFKPQVIKPERWNELYPYRLIVVKQDESNASKYVVVNEPDKQNTTSSSILPSLTPTIIVDTITQYGDGAEVTAHYGPSSTWSFTLPLTPQQLTITDQYAINTSATLKGLVEEHNGIRFKIIAASGTMGVFPGRSLTPPGESGSNSILNTIFAGTLDAFSSFNQQIQNVATAFTGGNPNAANLLPDSDPLGDEFTYVGAFQGTGYFNMMLMGQFLERYAEYKRDPKYLKWHLAIDLPKQNQTFLVTPIQFVLQQSANKPLEYTWSFQLKAWKRVFLKNDDATTIELETPIKLNSNFFSNAIKGIAQLRSTASSAIGLITAVRSDTLSVMDNVRQVSLLIKDISGVVLSVAELPGNLIKDLQNTISNIAGDLNGAGDNFKKAVQIITFSSQNNGTGGLSSSQASTIAKSKPNSYVAANMNASAANSIFNNPHSNYDFFSQIPVSSVPLTNKQQAALQNELNTVRRFGTSDLQSTKTKLSSVMQSLNNSFGAGDSTVAKTYKTYTPIDRAIPMTVEENEISACFVRVIQDMDALTANYTFDDSKTVNSLDYVGGLAVNNGIDFETITNKIRVPVPYGVSIEGIAKRYLGNPDRWLEIVTLNNLREPYIDEDGFMLTLLSNADGRQFNIDNSNKNLYLGQVLTLTSSTVPSFTRQILKLDDVNDSNTLVTVDGLSNLANLITNDGAYIKGYLPNTVNSQNQIWIPTDQTASDYEKTKIIPYLPVDNLTGLSKIDMLLDDNGDIVLNSFGDIQLANGMTNLIQAIKLKLVTEQGFLFRHPDYGFPAAVGDSLADIDVSRLSNAIYSCVANDKRFSGVQRVQIQLNGPILNVSIEVIVSGTGNVVPVSFQMS
jgi:hypothetical protein